MVNSRKELVNWFNSLGIQINRIEDLGKGTAICKLLLQIHPTFPSSFIKDPSNDYEYLKNMKIIQAFFIQNKIEMYFPVDKLVKCKLQDNLEVAQKLYKYYVRKTLGGERKEEVKSTNKEENELNKEEVKSINREEEKGQVSVDHDKAFPFSTPDKTFPFPDRSTVRKEIIENLKQVQKATSLDEKGRIKELEEEVKRLKEDLALKDLEISKFRNVMGELGSVKEVLRALEENRDFYFKKLVEIEKFLVENEEISGDLKGFLFEVLYRKQE